MRYFLLITFLSITITYAQEYAKSTEFKPVRMSYQDLKSLIDKTIMLASSANRDTTFLSSGSTHQLTVRGDDFTVTKKTLLLNLDYSIFPKEAYSVEYTFYSSNHPINYVNIDLSDYSRKITVQGTSPEQIEALFALLKNELDRGTIIFGGMMFRYWAYILATGFLLLLFINPGNILGETKFNKIISAIAGIMAVLFMFSIYFLPYEKHFPGFAVYSGEVSFIRRYSAEISLFFGLLSVLLSVVFRPKQNKSKQIR